MKANFLRFCKRCKTHKRSADFPNKSGHCRECKNELYPSKSGGKYTTKKREYEKSKRQTDIGYRMKKNLRSRLCAAIKNEQKSGSAIQDLGCSIEYLKSYIESKFQGGMTWKNYGEWQIDHIRSLASFDLTDRSQLLIACHYTNLQPMWKSDHIKKTAQDMKNIRSIKSSTYVINISARAILPSVEGA